MPVRPRPTEGSEGADGGSSSDDGSSGRPSKKLAAAAAAVAPPLPPPSLPAAVAAADHDEEEGNPTPAPPAPMAIDPPLPPAIGSDSGKVPAAPAAEAATPADASPLDRPHASNPPKQPTARTIVVAGMSPASFKDELLRIWPKRPNRKVRMVWINKHDAPPPLPEGWAWHEEHRCGAEALWEEVERARQGQQGQGAGFERWEGQQLFVIMGAGTSVQDFTQLKVANGASYPFDKELLQASVEVDVVDPERIVVLSDSSSDESNSDEEDDGEEEEAENVGPPKAAQGEAEEEGRKRKEKEERPPPAPLSPHRTPLQEPLCMQTLRFMASLRRAYLERRLPAFHRWLASQQHRLAGILTFNIDSLELLALDPALHGRVMQFHGNINQLTTIDALSQPYKTRPSVGPGGCPRVWYDPEALGRIAAACPDTSRLVDIVLEEASEVYLGSSSSSTGAQQQGQGAGGNGGGSDSSLRPSRPRRQTSALLSDTGAMDEVCRKLGRGLPLAAGLSSGELAKINAYFRARIRGMYLGNCVFTGEANDARLARASQSYLRSFVHEAGGGAGREAVFARLEREVAEINLARGVLPPAEEAALFAAAGVAGAGTGPGAGPGAVVVEVEQRREEEETVEVSVSGVGGGERGKMEVMVSSSVVTTTTTMTTLTVEAPGASKEKQPRPLEGGDDVGVDLNPPHAPQLVDAAVAATSD